MRSCPNASHKECCVCSLRKVCPDSKGKILPETSCNIPMPNVKSPKLELIPAAEAYKKTQEALKEDDIESLKEINSKILEATKKGKFSVTGLGEISFGARERLESLGYEIKTGLELNESYYIISWEREGN